MQKKPWCLPKMYNEQYRLSNEGLPGESKGLFLGEDGTVCKQKSYADIVAYDMLVWKIKAFLSTIDSLTITQLDLLPYQA